MARLLTMSTIVTRCQQRADLEGENHISASEWKSLVSEQYGHLYSLVAGAGLRHFESTATITADGDHDYALPADHLSTIAIARILGGTPPKYGYDLREAMAQEQSALSGTTGESRWYSVIGDDVFLYPAPPVGQTYQLRYVPQAADLSSAADGDSVDVITPDGEAFLIYGVAVKALAKSESDPRLALAERDAAAERLLEWATLRALHQPRRRIVDESSFDLTSYDEGDWRWYR